MKRVEKKGLSPVIASVLMILLVVFLAAIVFLWARGFLEEQVEKFGKPIGQSCDAVDFEISRTGSELEVVNKGNIDIRRLDIMMSNQGTSELTQFAFSINSGESKRSYVTLEMSGTDDPAPTGIIVYPVLVGKIEGTDTNNAFTCMDAGKKIL